MVSVDLWLTKDGSIQVLHWLSSHKGVWSKSFHRDLTSELFPSVCRSRGDPVVSLRCMKHCHPNDFACNLEPIHLITYTCLSLPTFRDFIQPEGETGKRQKACLTLPKLKPKHLPSDIIYLHTNAAFKAFPRPRATNVIFEILSADAQSSFAAQKRPHQGMIRGRKEIGGEKMSRSSGTA